MEHQSLIADFVMRLEEEERLDDYEVVCSQFESNCYCRGLGPSPRAVQGYRMLCPVAQLITISKIEHLYRQIRFL